MKKHLLVLGMIICMLGLTACGSSKADDTSYLSTEDALSCAEYYFDGLSQMSSEQLEEAEKQGYDVSVFKSAYSSYESSIDEIGVVTGMGTEAEHHGCRYDRRNYPCCCRRNRP